MKAARNLPRKLSQKFRTPPGNLIKLVKNKNTKKFLGMQKSKQILQRTFVNGGKKTFKW